MQEGDVVIVSMAQANGVVKGSSGNDSARTLVCIMRVR
jgi:hypothetical protein